MPFRIYLVWFGVGSFLLSGFPVYARAAVSASATATAGDGMIQAQAESWSSFGEIDPAKRSITRVRTRSASLQPTLRSTRTNSSNSVPTPSGDPKPTSVSVSPEIQPNHLTPQAALPEEPKTLPQAVAQAVEDTAISSMGESRKQSPSTFTVLGFGTLLLLAIDAVLLIMIHFHRPRRKVSVVEKRF